MHGVSGKGCTAVYAAMDTGSPLRENLDVSVAATMVLDVDLAG